MSSRPYAGRHRPASRPSRVPRALSSGFVLPTAAAAALVLTATGASVAQSREVPSVAGAANAFGLTAERTGLARTQASEARADDALATERRAQVVLQTAALQGRQQEAQRVTRAKQRLAVEAAAAAKAKAAAEAKAKAAARARTWVMPVTGATFTSGFKMRWGRLHAGNDLAAPTGTRLVSMSTGVVTFAGWQGGFGNKVEIRYWDGTVSYYGHMNSITAHVGQKVAPGDLVGYVGNTGHSFGAHLHLEIHPGGGPAVDPHPWMTQHGLRY